jgi:hypothetical protein
LRDGRRVGFGLPVMRGVADNGCILGTAALVAANFLGVSKRDQSLRPTQNDAYTLGTNVSILASGAIFVKVGEAVTQGALPLWDTATALWMVTAAAGRVALPAGWFFDSAAATNGLAILIKR